MVAALTEKRELVIVLKPGPHTCPWGPCPLDERTQLCCRSCIGLGNCKAECGQTLRQMCRGREG